MTRKGVVNPERETRLIAVSEGYMQGQSIYDMALVHGITRQMIQKDLALIRQRWMDQQVVNFGAAQNRELNALDYAEGESWDGWERSKRDKVKTVTVIDKEGNETSTVSREGQAGDSSFIAQARGCIQDRCKILGLFAPDTMVLGSAGPSFLTMPTLISELRQRLGSIKPTIIEANGNGNGHFPTGNGATDAGPNEGGGSNGSHLGQDAP